MTQRTDETKRIKRVADLMCSGHSCLRDRFARRALILDVAILSLSVWLTGLAFASEELARSISPSAMKPQAWLGVLGVATFILSIVQLKTDWKAKADAYNRASEQFSEVKREARLALLDEQVSEEEFRKVLSRNDIAAAATVKIPESDFLVLKQRHQSKVEISKYLDEHPFASVLLVRLRFWMRENLRIGEE